MRIHLQPRNGRFCVFFSITHLFELVHKVECNPLQFVAKAFRKIWGRVFNRALGIMEASDALKGRRIQTKEGRDIIFQGLEEHEFSHAQIQVSFPAIVIWKQSHAIVLTGFKNGKYEAIDSLSGHRKIKEKDFDNNYHFYTL